MTTTPTPTLLTYQPRPLNGGPLPDAGRKFGRYLYSPKYNGWRAMVHTPSSTMFNRHGQILTITSDFAVVLNGLKGSTFEWLDCEGLERRHKIGQGSLIVLDAPIQGTAYDRFFELSKEFPIHNCPEKPDPNSLLLAPQMLCDQNAALSLWSDLQEFNRDFGCDFYEGVVAKEADSTYPIQLRNPDVAVHTWIKHRWHW